MKLSNIKYFSTANGEGVRTCVFVSGCRLHCKGCFNKIAWNFNVGMELNDDIIKKILDSVDFEYIQGLSILGGEPLDENNIDGTERLITAFRDRFGDSKDIWIWSGYYYQDEMNTNQKRVSEMCDVLIDGRFESDKYNHDLFFKGSSNQTVWSKDDNGNFIKDEKYN